MLRSLFPQPLPESFSLCIAIIAWVIEPINEPADYINQILYTNGHLQALIKVTHTKIST
jgi:hypothetical protein